MLLVNISDCVDTISTNNSINVTTIKTHIMITTHVSVLAVKHIAITKHFVGVYRQNAQVSDSSRRSMLLVSHTNQRR